MDRLKSPLKGSPKGSPLGSPSLVRKVVSATKIHRHATAPVHSPSMKGSPESPVAITASPITQRRRASLSERIRRTSSPRPGSVIFDRPTMRAGEYGQCKVRLRYRRHTEELQVNVMQARDLQLLGAGEGRDAGSASPRLGTGSPRPGCMDVLAKTHLMSDKTKAGKRKARGKTALFTTVWSEVLAPYRVSKEVLATEVLRIQFTTAESEPRSLGEVYVPLNELRVGDKLEGWYWLQPARPSWPSFNRRGSVSKKQESDADAASAPLVSWLNQLELARHPPQVAQPSSPERNGRRMPSSRLAAAASTNSPAMIARRNTLSPGCPPIDAPSQTQEDPVLSRLRSYRDKKWGDLVPQIDHLGGESKKRAQAIWELFTSEITHLSNICVLADPFQYYLDLARSRSTQDSRVGPALDGVDADVLFTGLSELRDVSYAFAAQLEEVLVTGVAKEDATGESLVSDKAVDRVVAIFRDMFDGLVGPEMRYRLAHKQSRVYLEQATNKHPAFCAFLSWCEEDDRCGRMEFHDLLYQPLQRLTRYPLLLKAILKRLPEPTEPGASEIGRANLTKTVLLLGKAIEDHNEAVHRNESQARITAVENLLRWPSAVDNSPKAYVSPAHLKLLSFRPNVSLRAASFRLDAPSSDQSHAKRSCSYEGILTTVHRTGKAAKRLWAYLIDDLFVLAKSGTKTGWASAEAGGTGPADPMVHHLFHVSDIKVLDVPDDPPLVTNSITVVVLDGFGNPNRFHTFKTETQFEKVDWMRRLSARIDRYTRPVSSRPADPNQWSEPKALNLSSSFPSATLQAPMLAARSQDTPLQFQAPQRRPRSDALDPAVSPSLQEGFSELPAHWQSLITAGESAATARGPRTRAITMPSRILTPEERRNLVRNRSFTPPMDAAPTAATAPSPATVEPDLPQTRVRRTASLPPEPSPDLLQPRSSPSSSRLARLSQALVEEESDGLLSMSSSRASSEDNLLLLSDDEQSVYSTDGSLAPTDSGASLLSDHRGHLLPPSYSYEGSTEADEREGSRTPTPTGTSRGGSFNGASDRHSTEETGSATGSKAARPSAEWARSKSLDWHRRGSKGGVACIPAPDVVSSPTREIVVVEGTALPATAPRGQPDGTATPCHSGASMDTVCDDSPQSQNSMSPVLSSEGSLSREGSFVDYKETLV